jgi:hypothetical protein
MRRDDVLPARGGRREAERIVDALENSSGRANYPGAAVIAASITRCDNDAVRG